MFREIKDLIRKDRKLQWMLFLGLLVQLVVCIKEVGFSNFDQHFSIVEFSSYQLGNQNSAHYAFELEHVVKSSIQVYMFSAWYEACRFFHITDPFVQLTILRILVGLILFSVFNFISLYYFKKEAKKRILYWVILLLNFSWLFPYTRTLFSSEMMSSVFFFGTLVWYDDRKNKLPGFLFLALIGFLFSLAFYFRFQAGFLIAGFGIWLLFFEKKWAHLFPIIVGFLAGTLLNVYLDYLFYHQWVFTPYTYFERNILQDKASEYGTSSILRYIGLLVAVLPAPPFSIVFYFFSAKVFLKKYKEPVYLALILFLVGHFFIGHKEERFLYPVFNILPIVAGWGLPSLFRFYENSRRWLQLLSRSLLIITIVLNLFLLVIFTLNPWSQTVDFARKLKHHFRGSHTIIYCLVRTPNETLSGVPTAFYQRGLGDLEFKRISTIDSLRFLEGHDIYFASTFDELKAGRTLVDSLGWRPIMHSSKLIWSINEWLAEKNKPPINDIWALYKKE